MQFLNQVVSLYTSIRPLLDILILSFLIYKGYGILVKTQAEQLVKGAFFIVAIYAVAFFLKLSTLMWILNMLAPGLVIALAIIFQPELRKIFMRLGQGEWFKVNAKPRLSQLEAVLNAAEVLAGERRGALIVFPRQVGLKNIIDTGTRLNAELSSSLIVTVFGHDTPLHDGAMIVQGGKIVAAGCFLPLSEQQDIRRSFGTRHRAALGLSEESDAVILIVSEESGAISLAHDSKLYYDLNPVMIQRQLSELLDLRSYEAAETPEVSDGQ